MQSPGPVTEPHDDTALRALLDGGMRALRSLPPAIERDFHRQQLARLGRFLRGAMPWLFALHALVVIPGVLFRHDPSLLPWLLLCVAPMVAGLSLLWAGSHLPSVAGREDVLAGVGLFACLIGPAYCGMRLEGQYFGQLARYETLYVLIATFTIVQLPVRVSVPVALGALLVALVAAVLGGHLPFWLDVFLYFGAPLLMCSVTAYALEHAERRNYLQTHLLQQESQRLARLHAESEEYSRQQRFQADYLALISGNLPLRELFMRTLRFLHEHCGAETGVAYHVTARGRLRRVATWAVAADALDDRRELAPGDTLIGPALDSGETLHLTRVRADYLRLDLGLGSLPCAELLVLPVVQAGKPLAALEIGRVTPFTPEQRTAAEVVRTHLAYAVTAANAREIALRPAMA